MKSIWSLIEFPTIFIQRRYKHNVKTNSTYQIFQLANLIFVVRYLIFVPTNVKTDPNRNCYNTVDINLTSIGSTKLLIFYVSYPYIFPLPLITPFPSSLPFPLLSRQLAEIWPNFWHLKHLTFVKSTSHMLPPCFLLPHFVHLCPEFPAASRFHSLLPSLAVML